MYVILPYKSRLLVTHCSARQKPGRHASPAGEERLSAHLPNRLASRLRGAGAVGAGRLSGSVGRMENLDARVAGKSGPVEGENSGKPMHLHGGNQPGIMCGFSGNLILNDQALPNG